MLEEICARERCPISFVGVVNGNGYVTLIESYADFENYEKISTDSSPFNMHLKDVLGDMPQKTFVLNRSAPNLFPFDMTINGDNFNDQLMRVLSVLAVGSKRFLTSKVDRCVTGLIAQQQCIGPIHTPLADYAVTAVSHFSVHGIATSIGTQPIKGLINASAGARMSVAEAISNLVFVRISQLGDVKCSGNWMWAAKLAGEGARMYDTCLDMCQLMNELGVAIDGGKDSLSMAARVKNDTIKSPGTLVISTYAPCPDVRVKITPDLKSPALGQKGNLVWVNIERKFRIGGSALAQSYSRQGDDCPNIDNPKVLKDAFNVTQQLLAERKLLSGHDISDGGLVVCLLEMAFGGLCGLDIKLSEVVKLLNVNAFASDRLSDQEKALALLFAEECGWVLEVSSDNLTNVLQAFNKHNVPAYFIGNSTGNGLTSTVTIECAGRKVISGTTLNFLKQWERTSFELEKLQMNADCALEEYATYDYRTGPKFHCTFNPDVERMLYNQTIRVAVIREEGTNGDREMIATLFNANFEVHDVTMQDLLLRKTSLDQYRGVVFPGEYTSLFFRVKNLTHRLSTGGFSYADTLGSAKGWAASIMFSKDLAPQFYHFKNRSDTFSLGVCNGCQLMSLIGWVGVVNSKEIVSVPDVALLENRSER